MASNEATIPTGTHAPEGTRRDFLYIATGTVAAVGAAAVLVPLIAQMNPDASTLAAGGPVDLDVSKIAPGQQVVVRWRERPIFVFHRTPETLKTLQDPKLLALLSVRSSRNSGFWSEFAPIWAASRCSIRSRARPPRSPTGRAAISAPATVRNTIRPDASSAAFPRPTISRCRLTPS